MRLTRAAGFAMLSRCLCVLGATLLLAGAIEPVAAQQGDLKSTLKRFEE